MDIKPDSTRIDFERQGANVLVQIWFGKWREGSSCAVMDYLVDASIPALLEQCEKAGFTVEMMDGLHGRALRGEIVRVDIVKHGDLWRIRKYPWGWTARTKALTTREADETTARGAIQWMKDNGWAVYEWEDRACGWKGEPKPLHDRASILAARRRVNMAPPSKTQYTRGIDLAFYPQ